MTERIPREFIQQLINRTEIIDLIDGRVPLKKKSSNNYFACCPFHTEKSASFSVSQAKQFYYCFGCGAHGNALDFLMQFDRLSFPEAIEVLAKQAGMEIPRETKRDTPKISQDAYQLLQEVTQYYQQQLKQSKTAIDYLKQRGLTGEIAKEFGIGYAPSGWDHVASAFGKTSALKQQLLETGMIIKKEEQGWYDRFRDRIMFPIHDRRGRIVGFGGRILEKGEPKYLNSPETPIFQKGQELYGLYHALNHHKQLPRIVIVEGYMDVIALFQHGITYAVATLGTATTGGHIQRLIRYTNEIIFCFDGDNAGKSAAWRALLVTLPLMQDTIQVRFLFLPDGEDPDSLIQKENKNQFEERLKHAVTLSTFFFQSIAAQTDMSNVDGRARFIKLASEHLDKMPDSFFKQMMSEELAKRAGTNHINPLKKSNAPQFKSTPKIKTPSALRLALTLIIQNPTLVQFIQEPLPALELKGFDLFEEVVTQLKQSPDTTTGALLEHWREREEGKMLAKLAALEHMIPEDGLENEFMGVVQRIHKMGQEQTIQKLLAKAAQMELSSDEKQLLQQLIHSK